MLDAFRCFSYINMSVNLYYVITICIIIIQMRAQNKLASRGCSTFPRCITQHLQHTAHTTRACISLMRSGSSLEGLLLIFPFAGAFLGNRALFFSFLARPLPSDPWQSRSRHDFDCRFQSRIQRHVYHHHRSPLFNLRSGRRVRCVTRLAGASQDNDDAGEDMGTGGGGSEEEVSVRPDSDLPRSEVNHPLGGAEQDAVQAAGADRAGDKEDKGGEEEDGETVFLPTGAGNDFRLFRAKLRAGSEHNWQQQLRRNVNTLQLGGQDAWAHELSAPEKGCLIVAKTSVFSVTQTYFNEASSKQS